MSGADILADKSIEPHLKPGARDFLSNNSNTELPVTKTFDTNGNLTGFQIAQQQKVNIDSSFNLQDNENMNLGKNTNVGTDQNAEYIADLTGSSVAEVKEQWQSSGNNTYPISAKDAIANEKIMDNLDSKDKALLERNPDKQFGLSAGVNATTGESTGLKLERQEGVKYSSDTIETDNNLKSKTNTVALNDSFDDAAMKDVMQKGTQSENFKEFEARFDKAKGQNINNPNDDNKGERDRIIADTLYGLGYTNSTEGRSDSKEVYGVAEGKLSGKVPNLVPIIGGTGGSLATGTKGSTNENEQHSINSVQAQLHEYYQQSNTASEFLDKANQLSIAQENRMQEIHNNSDFKDDNEIEKVEQQETQKQTSNIDLSSLPEKGSANFDPWGLYKK